METMPKEIVNDAIERAAMIHLSINDLSKILRAKRSKHTALSLYLPKCLFEALLRLERLAPTVAYLCQPLVHVGEAEVEGVSIRKLIPAQGHGDRRACGAARRVGDVHRLAAHVHVVVHENLAGALRDAPFQRDVLRMQVHQVPANELRDLSCRVEIQRAADRHEDMQTGLARRLHDGLERHAFQKLAQPER